MTDRDSTIVQKIFEEAEINKIPKYALKSKK